MEIVALGSSGDDALEHVGEPDHRIDAVQFCCLAQRHCEGPNASPRHLTRYGRHSAAAGLPAPAAVTAQCRVAQCAALRSNAAHCHSTDNLCARRRSPPRNAADVTATHHGCGQTVQPEVGEASQTMLPRRPGRLGWQRWSAPIPPAPTAIGRGTAARIVGRTGDGSDVGSTAGVGRSRHAIHHAGATLSAASAAVSRYRLAGRRGRSARRYDER